LKSSPIFVGGAGRSGTTLLRVILDSHPNIACGPELKMTRWVIHLWEDFLGYVNLMKPPLETYQLSQEYVNSIFAGVFMSLIENYRKVSGKKRIADKEPDNVYFFQNLAHLFPESPLIHVIRDGRDVVCSLLQMNWVDPTTRKPLDYTQDVNKAAEYWMGAVRVGQETKKHPIAKENYIEVRYEDLVESPEATLKHLFERINEPWDHTVLHYYNKMRDLACESSAEQVSKPLYKNAVSRWERDLKPQDKDIIKHVAGDLLLELGYVKDHDW